MLARKQETVNPLLFILNECYSCHLNKFIPFQVLTSEEAQNEMWNGLAQRYSA